MTPAELVEVLVTALEQIQTVVEPDAFTADTRDAVRELAGEALKKASL
jgi:hypothetical protein